MPRIVRTACQNRLRNIRMAITELKFGRDCRVQERGGSHETQCETRIHRCTILRRCAAIDLATRYILSDRRVVHRSYCSQLIPVTPAPMHFDRSAALRVALRTRAGAATERRGDAARCSLFHRRSARHLLFFCAGEFANGLNPDRRRSQPHARRSGGVHHGPGPSGRDCRECDRDPDQPGAPAL